MLCNVQLYFLCSTYLISLSFIFLRRSDPTAGHIMTGMGSLLPPRLPPLNSVTGSFDQTSVALTGSIYSPSRIHENENGGRHRSAPNNSLASSLAYDGSGGGVGQRSLQSNSMLTSSMTDLHLGQGESLMNSLDAGSNFNGAGGGGGEGAGGGGGGGNYHHLNRQQSQGTRSYASTANSSYSGENNSGTNSANHSARRSERTASPSPSPGPGPGDDLLTSRSRSPTHAGGGGGGGMGRSPSKKFKSPNGGGGGSGSKKVTLSRSSTASDAQALVVHNSLGFAERNSAEDDEEYGQLLQDKAAGRLVGNNGLSFNEDLSLLVSRPFALPFESKNCLVQVYTSKSYDENIYFKVITSGISPQVLCERALQIDRAYEVVNAGGHSSNIIHGAEEEDLASLSALLINMFQDADDDGSGALFFLFSFFRCCIVEEIHYDEVMYFCGLQMFIFLFLFFCFCIFCRFLDF
jgi:hypothetical protein